MGEPHLRLKRDAPAGSSFDTVQPNPEFTEMLVGMGFPLELAQAGLSAVKNHSVDRAMDWIEEHRFDPEYQTHAAKVSAAAPAPQPVAAPVHAPEPTPVFTPMSRLAQTAEERRKHEEKERVAELAKLQREKAEAEAHKARVKAQFEEDRKARSKAAAAASAQAPTPSAAPATAAPTTTAKPAARAAPTEALLQIRLPSGETVRHTFPATATIGDVHTFVAEKIRTGNFNIIVPTPPRREYTLGEHAQLQLSKTDLCPRASVNILLTADRGQVLSAASAPAAAPAAPVVAGDAAAEELSYEQMLELEERMGKVDAGLAPALVASFPVVAYRPPAGGDDKATTKCFVCQEDFQANERVRLLPCLHTFHQKCIDRWFEGHKTCPMDNLRMDTTPS